MIISEYYKQLNAQIFNHLDESDKFLEQAPKLTQKETEDQCTKINHVLYPSNEKSESEMKTILFTIASERITDLRINLRKGVEYLYTENYNTLLTKFKSI